MPGHSEHAGVKLSGAPNREELRNSPGYPPEGLWGKGPLAFIECVEEIPCNPCETSCPQGAIKVGKPITNLPVLDGNKCLGCGACIAACPGLAIYVKDYTFSETEALITFPFEYWPLPEKGRQVVLVDEMGEPVCRGEVLRVVDIPKNNRTPLITVKYPKEFFEEVKSMQRL
ncbi:MAG: 4Fe-4S binding protein [Peptococcaceae bacterium]|jgi:ferredoxin|nr:4Fe-4S binding protein [Peptococcaceae bacterium]MDH7524635.1 4Fe-4S binding protein [Peptococcaceae bacterium]